MEQHINQHINSSETQQNLLRAQTVREIPPGDRLVPYTGIHDLLTKQAERYGEKPYLVYYDESGARSQYSYREFSEQVNQTANYLSNTGISRGDRIATIAHNHSDTVIQYLAAMSIGASVVPINVGEDDERIQYILENSKVKLAFARAEYLERIISLNSQLPLLQQIIVTGENSENLPVFPDVVHEYPVELDSPIENTLDEKAFIVYTSGTTGKPKGVVLQQYNLLVDAKAIAEWHEMDDPQRMMCVLPIHHVNGTVVTLLTPLYFGGTTVLNRRFQTSTFFPRIQEEGVQVVSVVPTLLQFLLQTDISGEELDLGGFRHIICGAGPLTVELGRQFEERFGIPIMHGYGLSETTCYSCFLPLDLSEEEHRHWMQDYGYPSIGAPIPPNEMDIHDEDGNSLEPGERGEIVIRGHNVMKYYFQYPDANSDTFKHGWFRSGDEGFYEVDEHGRQFFFITGRLKELIIRGGVNIAPLEIDEVLMHIDGVKAGIAVGFENDWYGEEVGAYIQTEDGAALTEEDILSECRAHLPFHKQPKVVVFGDEMPVTSTGKYQRYKVAHLFQKWKKEQFRQ